MVCGHHDYWRAYAISFVVITPFRQQVDWPSLTVPVGSAGAACRMSRLLSPWTTLAAVVWSALNVVVVPGLG